MNYLLKDSNIIIFDETFSAIAEKDANKQTYIKKEMRIKEISAVRY